MENITTDDSSLFKNIISINMILNLDSDSQQLQIHHSVLFITSHFYEGDWGEKKSEDSDSATAPSTEESVVLHSVTLYLLVQYTVLF